MSVKLTISTEVVSSHFPNSFGFNWLWTIIIIKRAPSLLNHQKFVELMARDKSRVRSTSREGAEMTILQFASLHYFCAYFSSYSNVTFDYWGFEFIGKFRKLYVLLSSYSNITFDYWGFEFISIFLKLYVLLCGILPDSNRPRMHGLRSPWIFFFKFASIWNWIFFIPTVHARPLVL